MYWLTLREILAIHDLQLAHHGGALGIRDMGSLESAMARAQNIAAYAEETPALTVLAAAYGAGVLRNRPFIDANKRTAMMAAFVFTERNGGKVTASPEEAYYAFHDLAAGKFSEGSLAQWLDANTETVSS